MKPRGVVLPEPPPDEYEAARAEAARAPEPAVAGNVLAGGAGWTHPSLLRGHIFYPRTARTAASRLAHYGKHFSLVEVDATYYTLIARDTAEHWLEAAPPELVFDIKAHPILTGHPIDIARLPADVRALMPPDRRRVYADALSEELRGELERRFFDSLAPLVEAGRLGTILIQFPPWFQATRANGRKLELVREKFPQAPFAVELRHASWHEPERRTRLRDLLEQHRLTHVCTDSPLTGSAADEPLVTTEDLAFFRFHGQNREAFSRRGASVEERFNYLYSQRELAAFVEPVRALSRQARRVHLVFNNCVRDYALLNAKQLVAALSGVLEAPPANEPR